MKSDIGQDERPPEVRPAEIDRHFPDEGI